MAKALGCLVLGLLVWLAWPGERAAWAQAASASAALPEKPPEAGDKPAEPAPRPKPAIKTTTLPDVALPMRVGVAVFVSSVGKLVDTAGTFDAELDVQLRWRDPRLAFNSVEVGTDRQEFGHEAAVAKLATIWTPQVTITNVNDNARIEPGLFIHADGSVVLIQHVKATFESKLRLAAFPFDSQILLVKLAAPKYSVNKIVLVQDQRDVNASGVREYVTINGWTLAGLTFAPSRVRAWNGDYAPEMEARIAVKRDPSSHLLVIFPPFLLIMVIPTLLTLYAKADAAPRLSAWAGSILALIALNFTFSVRFPALDSASLVTQVVATGLAYQLTMVVLTVTLLNPPVADKLTNKYLAPEVIGFLRWSMPLGMLAWLVTRALLTALS